MIIGNQLIKRNFIKLLIVRSYVDRYTIYFKTDTFLRSTDGLVGYDAALTQLRSGVRFSLSVSFYFFYKNHFVRLSVVNGWSHVSHFADHRVHRLRRKLARTLL